MKTTLLRLAKLYSLAQIYMTPVLKWTGPDIQWWPDIMFFSEHSSVKIDLKICPG